MSYDIGTSAVEVANSLRKIEITLNFCTPTGREKNIYEHIIFNKRKSQYHSWAWGGFGALEETTSHELLLTRTL
jgi:hypothetical protein